MRLQIYNLAANENVTLGEIARRWGNGVRFGSYRYQTGEIDNGKAAAVLPQLDRSSLATLERCGYS